MPIIGQYVTEWGIAEVLHLEDDLRFFPNKTIGFRLCRDGLYAACISSDNNITYNVCCDLWRELDSAISRYIRNHQICSPS